jgi:xylulokinase
MRAPPLVCGVDCGTTRIRALVAAVDGRIQAEAALPTPTEVLAPGIAQHDTDALWRTLVAVLREVTAAVQGQGRIEGIAVASFGEAGTLLDGDGRALVPALAWYDTRTAPDLEALLGRVGAAALTRTTGLCPDPTFALLKLLWLKRERPDAFARARRWLHVGELLAHRLGAAPACDLSLASRTMALDLKGRCWAEPLLREAGIAPELLAPLTASGQRIGRVDAAVAELTGLPEGCAIGLGGHDHITGALAVGADRPGVMLDSMGTAEALTLILAEPRCDPALGALGFNEGAILVDRPVSYIFGGLPTSAACVEWFRTGPANGAAHEDLIAEARAAPAGADGVLFLPHLRIGSPPFPDPVARGAFLGLSAEAGRGVLFRAVLEGLALDAANILDVLLREAVIAAPERIVVIGGSTRNALLLELKAAAFGRDLAVAQSAETTCLGAAMLAALAAGLFPSLAAARAAMAPGDRIVVADPALRALFARRREDVYAKAQAALRPLLPLLVADRRTG